MHDTEMSLEGLVDPLSVLSRFDDHDYTLEGFLDRRVARQPSAIAIEFENHRWSYIEFSELVSRWVAWLDQHHVQEGDRVAVISTNHPHTIAALFAVARMGAILVPFNPEYSQSELRHVLAHAEVKGIIVSPEKLGMASDALHAEARSAWMAILGDALDEELDALTPCNLPPRATPESVCLIIYTSGTTGFPKGVMHSQRGFLLAAEISVARLWLQPDERVMCVMPMFHINAIMYSVGGALACGGTLILVRRFSATLFWKIAASARATQVNLVAAAGSILAQRPRDEFKPHHIKKVFLTPLTRLVVEVFQNEFGVPVLVESYGMTEIPGLIGNPFEGPRKMGAMGLLGKHPDRRIDRPQVRIVDEQDRDVAPGVAGELLVKTPTIMAGYYKDPAQTQASFLDGWFRTGDLVKRADDGFFYFVERKKDIIRRRGENISSSEIERVISSYPGIREVAAIGVPSELGEEDILAALVTEEGRSIDVKELAVWMRGRLADMKIPRYFVVVPEIPRTPTHKPAKHYLKQCPDVLNSAVDVQPGITGLS